MLERILVPLDGSELSSRILWQVRRLMLRDDAHVELFTVVIPILESWRERPEDRPDQTPRHPELRLEETRRHLEQLQWSLIKEGASATIEVALGDPADQILKRVQRTRPSLVAMATHGRSGANRWLRGSVAQRVLRECTAPLLLVNSRITDEAAVPLRFRRILVPLDGSSRSAAVLPLVRTFAAQFESEVVLQQVVPNRATAADAREQRAALDDLADQLEGVGIRTRVRSEFGDPAPQILEAVEVEGVDLVAMSTHGSSGSSRWFQGSVTEKVLRRCARPLLVVNTRPGISPR